MCVRAQGLFRGKPVMRHQRKPDHIVELHTAHHLELQPPQGQVRTLGAQTEAGWGGSRECGEQNQVVFPGQHPRTGASGRRRAGPCACGDTQRNLGRARHVRARQQKLEAGSSRSQSPRLDVQVVGGLARGCMTASSQSLPLPYHTALRVAQVILPLAQLRLRGLGPPPHGEAGAGGASASFLAGWLNQQGEQYGVVLVGTER